MRQNRANRPPHSQSTQRERLLVGMLAAVTADGYGGATVANAIVRAGVSRRAFYEYFINKDDCFLALYRDISGHLVDQIAHAINDSPPERALYGVVRQLTEHAEAKRAQAQLLVSDAMAGGPRALEERRRTVGQISERVQTALGIASAKTPSPDLPTGAVIGATQWLIAERMRRGERNLTRLAQELTKWLTCYEHPIGKHRWSALSLGPLPEPVLDLPERVETPPRSVLAEKSSLLSSESAQSRRWRILFATAENAAETGYVATTVAAITARARLRRAVFYDHFRDKRQAFLTLHDLAFQQSMAVGATAYFSVKHWPERVWHCLLATSQLHAAHPAIAHVGLVETHALGLPAIQRVEDSRLAFATLLRADSQGTSALPSVTAAEAIGAAIFEIAYDRVLHKQAQDLPRYTYLATYLALAPFLGVEAADRFVERKLDDAKKHERPATKRRGRA